MKTYEVTIQATIQKTITAEAQDERHAVELAHEEFSVLSEQGQPENYREGTVDVREVK